MIGPFLVLIGLLLLYVNFKGDSAKFLGALGFENLISSEEKNLGQNLSDWAQRNIWDKMGKAIKSGMPGWLGGP